MECLLRRRFSVGCAQKPYRLGLAQGQRVEGQTDRPSVGRRRWWRHARRDHFDAVAQRRRRGSKAHARQWRARQNLYAGQSAHGRAYARGKSENDTRVVSVCRIRAAYRIRFICMYRETATLSRYNCLRTLKKRSSTFLLGSHRRRRPRRSRLRIIRRGLLLLPSELTRSHE